MSAETEISNIEMAASNSLTEDMSTTDESMGANMDDQAEPAWETAPIHCPTTNAKSKKSKCRNDANSHHEKIPLKIPGNAALTTTSVASAAAAAALASAAADAAAMAAAYKINPHLFPCNPNGGNFNGMDKPYKCDTCDKAFSLRRALKAHKRVHTGEKPFKCDTCPKAFSHQGALKAHKRVHTGERPFKCDVCDMSFSHRSTLITHRRTHTGEKPFKCDLCDEVFSYRQTMKSHRKKHLAAANAGANAAILPIATGSGGMVVTSSTAASSSTTLGNIATTTTNTTTNTATAAKRQLFKCKNCAKECTSREELDAHIEETHPLEKNPSFRCFTCNKTFSNCDTLEKHKLTHPHLILPPHAIKSEIGLLPTTTTSNTNTNAGLKTEKIVVGGANNKDTTNGDVLPVPNSFSSVSSPHQQPPPHQQPQHQQQQASSQQHPHHQPHQQHPEKQQLPTKKKTTHNNNNNNNSNSNSNNTSNALGPNRIHIEERPYKCCICNEGFPTITALTNHERTHNDDTSMSLLSSSLLSSYACDICGVVFSEKSNLDAHKKMHVNENPFDYKPITVASQKDYSDSPFECTICGALFTNNMWSSSA